MAAGLTAMGRASTGRWLKNHVRAVVIIAALFVASKVLSLRIAMTGGGKYLVGNELKDIVINQKRALTVDSPTTSLVRTTLSSKAPMHVQSAPSLFSRMHLR